MSKQQTHARRRVHNFQSVIYDLLQRNEETQLLQRCSVTCLFHLSSSVTFSPCFFLLFLSILSMFSLFFTPLLSSLSRFLFLFSVSSSSFLSMLHLYFSIYFSLLLCSFICWVVFHIPHKPTARHLLLSLSVVVHLIN